MYDGMYIGGATRCWKVGLPVVVRKGSTLEVIPVLFLRGQTSLNKHLVVLWTS